MGRVERRPLRHRPPEGTQYFLRAILEVPIHGVDQPFLWGLWVSASEASFHRYLDSYDRPPEDPFSLAGCPS